jgi:hypothetical protein
LISLQKTVAPFAIASKVAAPKAAPNLHNDHSSANIQDNLFLLYIYMLDEENRNCAFLTHQLYLGDNFPILSQRMQLTWKIMDTL